MTEGEHLSVEACLAVLEDASRSAADRVAAARRLKAEACAAPVAWRLVVDTREVPDVRLAAIDLVERATFAGWCLDDNSVRAAQSMFEGAAYSELTDRWMRLLGTRGTTAAVDALFAWASHTSPRARAAALDELVQLDPPERRARLDAALAAAALGSRREADLAARRRVARTWQIIERRELAPPDFVLELIRARQLGLLVRLVNEGRVPLESQGMIRAELLALPPGGKLRRFQAAILKSLSRD